MRIASLILSLCLGTLLVEAQTEREFIVKGEVALPDGYSVGICCQTDTSYSVEVANGHIKNGQFTLKGSINHPLPGTLMTNNLELVDKNHWPTDSIHWTYTEIFLSADTLHVDRNLNVTGGQVQADFNAYQAMANNGQGEGNNNEDWTFIAQYPQSVISVFLANNLLKRGYNLTTDQVTFLEKTITCVPEDSVRMAEFHKRIAFAKQTTKGGPLIDLELNDVKGNVCHLTDVVPSGKYVLADFWASWCGICIASMPAIRQLAEEYKDKFSVVAVSIDTKREAWQKAMSKHPEPWPQYITTRQGYDDLFNKYQVGNGVPYYLMITPEGKVLGSPASPDEVKAILENYQ